MKYLIKRGDTLSAIAEAHGVSVDDLMKLNPQIKDRNKIYAGKTLDIPTLGSSLGRSILSWLGLRKGD